MMNPIIIFCPKLELMGGESATYKTEERQISKIGGVENTMGKTVLNKKNPFSQIIHFLL